MPSLDVAIAARARCTPQDEPVVARAAKAAKLWNLRTRLAVGAARRAWRRALDAETPASAHPGLGPGAGVLAGCPTPALAEADLAAVAQRHPEVDVTQSGDFARAAFRRGLPPLWLLETLPNMMSAHIAIELQLAGANRTITSHSQAGLQAVGEAALEIAAGELSAAVAGGAEVETPWVRAAAHASARSSGGTTKDPAADGASFLVLTSGESSWPLRVRSYRCGLGPAGLRSAAVETLRDGWRGDDQELAVVSAEPEERAAATDALASAYRALDLHPAEPEWRRPEAAGAGPLVELVDALDRLGLRRGLCLGLGYPAHFVIVAIERRA